MAPILTEPRLCILLCMQAFWPPRHRVSIYFSVGVFVVNTPQALQATLTAAVKAYSRLGLTVNTVKTEVLYQQNSSPPTRPPSPVFSINNTPLAVVPDFKYLGSIISETCSMDNDVQNRIKAASASFAHPWTNLDTEVLKRTGTSMEATLLQYQLRWVGHTIRMTEDRLPQQLLYGQLRHGQRSARSQKRRYKDQLKTTLKKCGIQYTQLESTATDRPLWRRLCQAGIQHLEEERSEVRERTRQARKMVTAAKATTTTDFICPHCNRPCGLCTGLHSHLRTHQKKK
ncbi:hypothetical protein ABVT39_005195 [Epinephelus coioides]